jgi:hypothetical protein
MLGIVLMAALGAVGAGNGNAAIPNSCSMAVQTTLETGMRALHNFEYEEASQAFEAAQKTDNSCVMAWWGAAMTQWHELWDPSDAIQLAAGWKDIEEARKRSAGATPQERAYLDAIAAYFSPGKDGSAKAGTEARTADGRALAYREKMRALHEAYPKDTQATLFYGLSILAANDQGTRAEQIEQAQKAGALIEPVFAAEPENPGAAHYLIHTYDRPELAAKGLAAARAYAKIAPNAPHALHMPAHIFERLGLWREVVDSDLASFEAAKAAVPQTAEKIHEQLHASDFLQYGYLQLAEFTKAQQTTETAVAIAKAHVDRFSKYIEYTLPVRMVIEEQKWSEWKSVPVPEGKDDAYWKTEYAWMEAMAEARSCSEGTLMATGVKETTGCSKKVAKENSKRAAEAVQRLVKNAAESTSKKDSYGDVGALDVLTAEAQGWAAFARGDKTEAIAKMKDAVAAEAKPGSYGGFRKPAAEMLGDLYLLLGDKTAAAAAYEASLKEHVGRRLSELGLKAAQS